MKIRLLITLFSGLLGATAVIGLQGCATATPAREPLGEPFPAVRGKSLEGVAVQIPGDFRGRPILLLIGYVQEAQFDLDRWLLGALQAKTTLEVREIPTIEGFFPGLFEETIDQGMRNGIPSEDWGSVITVYEDAGRIVEFLGDERPRNGRAVLLDADGRVVRVHADGYSARVLLEFLEVAERLAQSPQRGS